MINDDLILGIDASNIRLGGGITHLIELLTAFDPKDSQFRKVILWSGKQTLSKIPNFHWLEKNSPYLLNKGLLCRIIWQFLLLGAIAKKTQCSALLVPGGIFMGHFSPAVTMSQNLLPFETSEIARYGFSLRALKFIILRKLQAISFQRSSGIIFLSNYAKNTVNAIVKNLPIEVKVIPHGLGKQFEYFSKIYRSDQKLGITDPIKLIYVSNIDLYKHQPAVIEAAYLLRKKGYMVELLLVGPAVPSALYKMNAAIDFFDPDGGWVKYVGEIPYTKISEFYKGSDIGVFASSCETFGITLLEKMASGLPVATSNRSCLPEILKDGGLYFDPENPQSISDAIEKYILSTELRLNMSQRARILAERYSWKSSAQSTFAFLEKVVRECDK
jgi:glycosyltransferase involved in cell wall biosynthesis